MPSIECLYSIFRHDTLLIKFHLFLFLFSFMFLYPLISFFTLLFFSFSFLLLLLLHHLACSPVSPSYWPRPVSPIYILCIPKQAHKLIFTTPHAEEVFPVFFYCRRADKKKREQREVRERQADDMFASLYFLPDKREQERK